MRIEKGDFQREVRCLKISFIPMIDISPQQEFLIFPFTQASRRRSVFSASRSVPAPMKPTPKRGDWTGAGQLARQNKDEKYEKKI